MEEIFLSPPASQGLSIHSGHHTAQPNLVSIKLHSDNRHHSNLSWALFVIREGGCPYSLQVLPAIFLSENVDY